MAYVSVKQAALDYLANGISVIPTGPDKAPMLKGWKEYYGRLPTIEEVDSWNWTHGVGLICGTVSENLLCLDLDAKNDPSGTLLRDYAEVLNSIYPGLLERLVSESTPSVNRKTGEVGHPGRHLLFRTPNNMSSKDYACSEENKVLIETRGEASYFVGSPSPGYEIKKGEIKFAPMLLAEEVEAILSAAESLNKYVPEHKQIFTPTEKKKEQGKGITPFDEYDQKTTPQDMADILVSIGWEIKMRRGDVFMMLHPKATSKLSATINHIPGRLWVFSTSTEFEIRKAYKPSQMFTALNYPGDFSSAARALYAKGFGDRQEKQKQEIKTKIDLNDSEKIKIVKPSELRESLHAILSHGMDVGLETGFPNLDIFVRLVKGHLNIVTGIPSHGKSEMVDAIFLNAAKLHNWKFLIYSPENYPIQIHIRKFAEKIMLRNFFSKTYGRADTSNLDKAIDFMDGHFEFIDAGESEMSLEGFLEKASEGKYDAVLIDPWNEIEATRPNGMTEHEHIGKSLSQCRRFARKNKISFWIVAHPIKMYKDQKSGEVPVPNMYDINGSSHWFNKADNGFCVYRDHKDDSSKLFIQKVKFRYYGKPGEAKFKYIQEGGIYKPWDSSDDFSISNTNKDYKSKQAGDKND